MVTLIWLTWLTFSLPLIRVRAHTRAHVRARVDTRLTRLIAAFNILCANELRLVNLNPK